MPRAAPKNGSNSSYDKQDLLIDLCTHQHQHQHQHQYLNTITSIATTDDDDDEDEDEEEEEDEESAIIIIYWRQRWFLATKPSDSSFIVSIESDVATIARESGGSSADYEWQYCICLRCHIDD